MSRMLKTALVLTERGWVPDRLVRRGIRRLIGRRLREIDAERCEAAAARQARFIRHMDRAPIAPLPEKANEQHYEVPSAFFTRVLGPHLKYSSGCWDATTRNLAQAEANALRLTCERAGVGDGMSVLELGCGWGSLTLWIAERFPHTRVTAVSNSHSQRAYVTAAAAARGLGNVEVITADMNAFVPPGRYDRIVSVEMLEHMRNYRALFERIATWLVPDGRFFMHIFCHRSVPYAFEARDDSDWMSRYFFSGGFMPSDALALRFQDHLVLHEHWRWPGTHYQRTAEAWLRNMDRARDDLIPILRATYGGADAERWWVRWRVFFAACAELFGYDRGEQWWVSHYLFAPRSG